MKTRQQRSPAARRGAGSRAGRRAAAAGACASTAPGPVRDYEVEVAVERLCLDSTSHRNLRERADGDPGPDGRADRRDRRRPRQDAQPGDRLRRDPARLGRRGGRGRRRSAARPGARVASLASLTLIPLRLDSVDRVDPDSPQVDVTGYRLPLRSHRLGADARPTAADDGARAVRRLRRRARRCGRSRPAPEPSAYSARVTPASSPLPRRVMWCRTRRWSCVDVDARRGRARRRRSVSATSRSRPTCATRWPRSRRCARPERRRPTSRRRRQRPGCEPAAALLTADGGTVLFFSMATSFSAAALAADGIGTELRMIVGSGYAPDTATTRSISCAARAPLREALGTIEEPRDGAASGADALARPRRARPRQPHGRPHLSGGGPRRVPRRHGIRRDEYVVGRCSVGFNREIAAADGGDGRVRGAAVGSKSVTTSERDRRRRRRQSRSRRSSRSCSGIPAARDPRGHGRGARLARRTRGGGLVMAGTRTRRRHLRDHRAPTSSARTTRTSRTRPRRSPTRRSRRRRRAPPSPTCTCARTTARRAAARSCSSTRSTGSAPAATC